MTAVNQIARKTKQPFLFEVQLSWLEDNFGLVHSTDVNGELHVAISQKFGGTGSEWSAEHLLLCSLASCFMSTFLEFKKKMVFEIAHLECTVIGQIGAVKDKYRFRHIDVYPNIYIVSESVQDKAAAAVAQTQKHCIVANSLNTALLYHTRIISGETQFGGEDR